MWFLIHTTITHISNFIFGHHNLRPENHKQHHSSTWLHPARPYLIPPLIPLIPIPINAQQPSTTKILDKRTTWILVNNTIQTCYDRKPTSWPSIKIAYAQPTNLDPLPIESNIEQTWQPKMTQPHIPPVNHNTSSCPSRSKTQPSTRITLLWASLSIEHSQIKPYLSRSRKHDQFNQFDSRS